MLFFYLYPAARPWVEPVGHVRHVPEVVRLERDVVELLVARTVGCFLACNFKACGAYADVKALVRPLMECAWP